jgi:hypothetical protein
MRYTECFPSPSILTRFLLGKKAGSSGSSSAADRITDFDSSMRAITIGPAARGTGLQTQPSKRYHIISIDPSTEKRQFLDGTLKNPVPVVLGCSNKRTNHEA